MLLRAMSFFRRRRLVFAAASFTCTVLVCLLYQRIRTIDGITFDWNITPTPECRVDYSPPESYGRISPAWTLRPGFVQFTDNCINDLRRSRQTSNSDSSYLIPRIIHQVWDSDEVPELYINWTRSWLKVNPGWQHWFWTLSDVRNLVSRHYPAQLQTWDSYPKPIFRADAMRYFVLHRYGGVYADLDYEALRPLDLWAQRYRCLFSEEPYEHAFLLHKRASTFLSSAFIACAQGHPALMAVINRMNSAFEQFRSNVMYATGPFMINPVLETYAQSVQNRRQQSHLQCVDASVTIAPPYYFQPVFSQAEAVQKICNGTLGKPIISEEFDIICAELRRTNFSNKVNSMAFAVHWWFLAWMKDSWRESKHVKVSESVPGIMIAGQKALIEKNFTRVKWCV